MVRNTSIKYQYLAQNEMERTRFGNRYRSDDIVHFMRKRSFKIGIAVALVVLIAILIFVCGYYAGGNSQSSKSDDKPLILPDYMSSMRWYADCSIKSLVCPESYHGVPPLILISLDGFRSDYLNRGYTPTLDHIAKCGTHSPHMYPVFPSKTFPNHYSIVTGLYPESHGIIGNIMYNPETMEVFRIGEPVSFKPYWWEAEPIWVTAERQGKKAHLFYWIGSDVEIKGVRPTLFRKYDKEIPFEDRVDVILEWLDLPQAKRPSFMTLYMRQPDASGHNFGPTSYQLNQALTEVDKAIAKLFHGLQKRSILNCVNVIILSDHGMTSVDCNRVVNLEKYINVTERGLVFTHGPYGRMRLNVQVDMEKLTARLRCTDEHMKFYRKENLPIRYHYSHHKRIESVFLEMDLGWSLGPQDNQKYCSGGAHGYDNYLQDMRAIFMAYGPSFKSRNMVAPFQNIELYELMAEIMNITANPNNGTMGSLHHLLQNPRTLSNHTEPTSQPIGEIPLDREVFNSRIRAANCTCKRVEEKEQQEVENISKVHVWHLPFGIPHVHEFNQSQLLLYNNDYISAYDTKYRLPVWSSFTLYMRFDIEEIEPCWKGDARIIPTASPSCTAYNPNIETRADVVQRHLFPLTFGQSFLDEAFLITNSVPKSKSHVEVYEQHFNRLLVFWYQLKGPLNVVAGPAFDITKTGVYPGSELIMRTQSQYGSLVMPTHYFYVITWCKVPSPFHAIEQCKPANLSVAAFIFPNIPIEYTCQASSDLIKKNVVRVVDVEKLTGMSFYTKLPTYEAIRLRTMIPEI